MGPNVKRLIAHRISTQAVPPGGGVSDALRAIVTPGKLGALAKEATTWVEDALAVVKSAPDNPFGDNDEAIAAELLRRIDERSPLRSRR